MLTQNQIPDIYRQALSKHLDIFSRQVTITQSEEVPSSEDYPYANQLEWLKIPSIICVYVDMRGSTALSAEEKDKTTAASYQLFTGTAVRLFSAFEASYIDVRGDGAFAIFDKGCQHIALASAVTFKTFCSEEIIPKIRHLTGEDVGNHIGIDQRVVLVRKIGFKRRHDSEDWRNEVWAGRPVNMSAKLASLATDNEIMVSDRYFNNLTSEKALKSCGCSNGRYTGTKSTLWSTVDLSDNDNFDFDRGYVLKSIWCPTHGKEYCEALVKVSQ